MANEPKPILVLAADEDDAYSFLDRKRRNHDPRLGRFMFVWPGRLHAVNETGYYERLIVTAGAYGLHEAYATALMVRVLPRTPAEMVDMVLDQMSREST